MRHHLTRSIRILLGALLASCLAAGLSASWAQDRGVCVGASVPAAFMLPDGSLHPAGRITLCTLQAFTPVLGLHRIWTEGEGASFAMSRRATAEAPAGGSPVLLFRRVPGAPLDLVGYVVPHTRSCWSYALRRSETNGFANSLAIETARSSGEVVTIVASNLN